MLQLMQWQTAALLRDPCCKALEMSSERMRKGPLLLSGNKLLPPQYQLLAYFSRQLMAFIIICKQVLGVSQGDQTETSEILTDFPRHSLK